MAEKEEWNKIEVPNEEQEIEIEIEEEEVETKPPIEEEEEKTPELEGIETKGAEKRIRQLIRQRKERDEHISTLIQKNEELSHTLRTKDKEVSDFSKLTLDASEKQLTDKIELARTVYMEAFEEGEKEKLLKAQEMLNEAQTDLKAVSSAKQQYEEVPEPVQQPEVPQYTPPQQTTNPMAESWAAQNSWFGQDNIKTAAALAIDAELKGEGYNPGEEEFYQEIDNRMNRAFNNESQDRVQESSSIPAQVVSGGSRLSQSNSNKVKLSKEDVRLAQKWNIPLEQYAAEKLKVSDADGNYTNVR
tara:strand:+ start:2041 stop:2946 length:906 start_codon:yes stop_codon:yes gene_type:complete